MFSNSLTFYLVLDADEVYCDHHVCPLKRAENLCGSSILVTQHQLEMKLKVNIVKQDWAYSDLWVTSLISMDLNA